MKHGWESTRAPLFSQEECDDLCQYVDQKLLAEENEEGEEGAIECEQGDGVYGRIRVSDADLSSRVKERLETDMGDRHTILPEHYTLNHMWFLTRYPTGGHLEPHCDGTITSEDGTSVLTLLVYINDEFTGGHTSFLDDVNEEEEGCKLIESVEPRKGHGLLLKQHVLHVGEAVSSGVKYMLRTDIMVR